MKQARRILLAMLAVILFVESGLGCSPEGSSAVFTQVFGPDQPYASYAKGRLGVIGRGYRIRNFVVAYDTLSGRGLTTAEQKAAEGADRYYNPEGYASPDNPNASVDPTQKSGIESWHDATGGAYSVEHKVPGQDYETFTNCLDDAFAHAAATLAELRAKYGKPGAADPPDIQDWIAGQQAVFSNCSDGSSREFQYPPAPPPPPATMPKPAPANAPLWLRQDRVYQLAAAQFYALDYDAALAGFRAIAGDKSSPWAPLARYVIARVLIRMATLPTQPAAPNLNPEAAQKAAEDRDKAVLAIYAQARDQLQGILRDPAMKALHPQSEHLLDFVMLRLDPHAQAEELARRLSAPIQPGAADTDYKQNVIDLGYAYTSLPQVAWPQVIAKGKPAVTKPRSPLLRWMDDMYGAQYGNSNSIGLGLAYQRSSTDAERLQDALTAWRETHGAQWLVAALTIAQPGDDGVNALIDAAMAIAPTSPAYPSVTYHRLRLAASASRTTPSSYAEVAALLPGIERTQSRSTINLFLDAQASLAPTLDAFLKSSTSIPASYTDVDGFEDGSPTPDYPIETRVTLCGTDVYAPKTLHFDDSVAAVYNQRMPLSRLLQAALSSTLPPNLRFQLAHMTWTRALLLDDPETARALAPYLAQCQPAFKTWLDQYAAAETSDERHVLGLLAMMRFTSTEPMVRAGGERDFAAYDDYRGNWWSDERFTEAQNPIEAKKSRLFSQLIVPRAGSPDAQPDPPFLTAADRAAADREIAALLKIGYASDYFAHEALDWVKSHPTDPHDADVLGFAMRVMRNASRDDASKELNHQLFDTLHRSFPKSEWATRYTTWE
jgi:hypothetical protein